MSSQKKPSITVVTPVYQGEAYLEETIDSVLSQNYPDLDYRIIDGGSTDGTVDIIKRYEKHLGFWISESDNGMYDAIHKGLSQAQGEIQCYLNADDLYYEGALDIVGDTFSRFPSVSLVYGDYIHYEQELNRRSHYRSVQLPRALAQCTRMPFAQPSSFWKTALYHRLGGFDLTKRYCGDYHFFARCFLDESVIYRRIPQILSVFRIHGENLSHHLEKHREEHELAARELGIYNIPGFDWKSKIGELMIKMPNLMATLRRRL